jgi:hypothetical protein
MEPMNYGEMVAAHLDQARRTAALERRARRAMAQRDPAGWRVAAGRLLVAAGERVAGCADLARGEAKPVVRILG